jgi:uncharacterized RDD family membrane protein YckC
MMYGVLYGLTGHALDDTPWQDLGLAAGILLTWTGYFALMESSRWQATLGKRLFRLRVVGPGSGRISFGRAVGRAVLKLLGLGILYLGLIPALFTRQRQTLHDLVTGTVVVRRPPASAVNPDLDMQ